MTPDERKKIVEEVVRRGREIYDREIHAQVEASHEGEFVVVDVTSGAWEIDEDDVAASDRALAKSFRLARDSSLESSYLPNVPGLSPMDSG